MRNEDKSWLLIEADYETGPFTFAQLQQRYLANEIGGNTLSYPKGLFFGATEWRPLRHYFPAFQRDVKSTVPPVPPVPPNANSNRPGPAFQRDVSPVQYAASLTAVIGILLIIFGSIQWSSAESQLRRALGEDDLLAISLFVGGGIALLVGITIGLRSWPSVSTSPPPITNSVEERLRQLDTLRSQQLISDAEYAQRRKNIIASL